VKIIEGEVLCNIEPTTPISRESFTAVMDDGLRLISEYRFAIRVLNAGWKKEAQAFKAYLRKFMDLCDGQ
jgi:hypothetical protein